MALSDLLTADSVKSKVRASCKREALSRLAGAAASALGLDERTIYEALIEREKLGTTGVGEGVAIPHGKIDGLSNVAGFLATLDEPVAFDSVDDAPVDILFLLLAPTDATAAHLKALAKVSRLLRDEGFRASLRGADTDEALFAAANSHLKRSDAA
ncbi:MAG: PTS sugar transporter subunit IIA [Pseudomonadota bacterium]